MKILLIAVGCLGLCSCGLMPPYSDNSYDEDHHVSPVASSNSRLADPRVYMDKDDPNIQRLVSQRMF